MRLCPRCSARFRASNRTRDGFDDLGDDYDLFDEEVDTLIDEAIDEATHLSGRPGGLPGPVRHTRSPWLRFLRLAEGAIRSALSAFLAGQGLGVVANAIVPVHGGSQAAIAK
jgi:hypothetical protein